MTMMEERAVTDTAGDRGLAIVRWVLNTAIDRTRACLRGPVFEQALAAGRRPSEACGDAWVASLHDAFEEIYGRPATATAGRVEVFSRTRPSRISANGARVCEVLHDLLVAETVDVRSAAGQGKVTLVRRPIWQVESEVHASSREVG